MCFVHTCHLRHAFVVLLPKLAGHVRLCAHGKNGKCVRTVGEDPITAGLAAYPRTSVRDTLTVT